MTPNTALTPVSPTERVFTWNTHASLWFSMGVGLLVMQMGALLVPALGSRDAVLAILFGSLIGSALLAWMAKLGADRGLSSAALIHLTYGQKFAHLPVFLNVVQLVGWTMFELVIMRDGILAISKHSFGWDLDHPVGIAGATLLLGAVLTLMLSGNMTTTVRKILNRYALPLVVLSLTWLTWRFSQQLVNTGISSFWQRSGNGEMSLLSGMDLVIAMPISWLPLVADYARYGRSGRGAFAGTWLGYSLANIWCYALGLLAASVAPPTADLVTALLLAQGGLFALGLILLDEIDNAYGDLYSGAVSSHSIAPKFSVRQWSLGLAVMCTGLAMFLPMRRLEDFLLILSSVFVPLFGVILGRLGGTPAQTASASRTSRPIDWSAAALWLAGIIGYQALIYLELPWGATLPTLAASFALAWLTRQKSGLIARSPKTTAERL